MTRITRFLRSSIGGKVGTAVTGLLLSLFVVGHLIGNLLIYKGRDAVNTYAESLQALGPLLWLIRAGLAAVFVTHVVLAIRLKLGNRAARPVRYVHEDTVEAPLASRTMVLSGLLVLAFLLMHLLHFTLGTLQPGPFALTQTVLQDGTVFERHDVYSVIVAGFRSDLFVLAYVLAMLVLGMHLSHALHSAFQTLGWRHPAYTPWGEKLGRSLAWLLAAGYITIPFAIRLGFIGAEAAS